MRFGEGGLAFYTLNVWMWDFAKGRAEFLGGLGKRKRVILMEGTWR